MPSSGRTIAILTLGSRGDVQPALALASALRARGHAVRIAAHESQRARVTAHGVSYLPVRPDLGAVLDDPRVSAAMERGDLPLLTRFLRIMRELRPQFDAMPEDLLAACRGADLVVYPKVYGLAGHYIAEALGVPGIPFALQPVDPTGDFATLALPPRARLGRWANARSHQLMVPLVTWHPFRRATNQMLARHFPGARAPWRGPYAAHRAGGTPTLYAFSPHVVPKPADWDDTLQLTGYWWLEEPEWTPPADLVRFLAAGPPPVYVGFGSMPSGGAQTTRLVLDALRAVGMRAVLAGRWNAVAEGELEERLFPVRDVPHSWLFPQMAAVVHHAGAGTTAATLRAGVPTIGVPFFLDQPFWAERAYRLGVGTAPVPLRRLTATGLAEALRVASTDVTMRERCTQLAERLRLEDGVGRACEIIEAAVES